MSRRNGVERPEPHTFESYPLARAYGWRAPRAMKNEQDVGPVFVVPPIATKKFVTNSVGCDAYSTTLKKRIGRLVSLEPGDLHRIAEDQMWAEHRRYMRESEKSRLEL